MGFFADALGGGAAFELAKQYEDKHPGNKHKLLVELGAALAGAEGTALATKYGPEEYEKLKQHFNNHAAEHDDIEALPTNYNPGYN